MIKAGSLIIHLLSNKLAWQEKQIACLIGQAVARCNVRTLVTITLNLKTGALSSLYILNGQCAQGIRRNQQICVIEDHTGPACVVFLWNMHSIVSKF